MQSGSARLKWIVAFAKVAAAGTYVAAAADGHAHPTTLKRAVDDLQRWLGRILLTSDVPVELTPDGKEFRPVAAHIVELIDRGCIRTDLSRTRVQPDGTVLIYGLPWDKPEAREIGAALIAFRANVGCIP